MTAPLPSSLSFPHADIPAPGRIAEVAPGVMWLRMPLPFALDHINLWLLVDEIDGVRGWTAIDCGYGDQATREIWQQHFGDTFRGMPLLRVIVTHYHPDHLGNAQWLLESNPRAHRLLWSTQSDFYTAHVVWQDLVQYEMHRTATFFARHGMPADVTQAQAGRGNLYRIAVPELPQAFRRIVAGDEIMIGGHAWRVIVGVGHSPEHASFWCRALNVLISGDMLLPKISTNVSTWGTDPEGDPLRMFLASIRAYNALPADVLVLPSHGLPFVGAHARVKALEQHHAERIDELLAAASSPVTAYDLLPVLFRRKLDIQQQFFAMGESVAHLNHLWHQGRVRRIPGPDGIIRFNAHPQQE